MKQELDIIQIVKILTKAKRMIFACTILAAGLSVALALYIPNKYISSVLLAPVNENSQSQLSGLSESLASFTGASINAGSVSKVDIVLATLRSRQFVNDFIKRRNIKPALMAVERWDKASNKLHYDDGIYDIENNEWANSDEPSNAVSYIKFVNNLSITTDVQTGLITFAIKSPSPMLAQQWVEWLLKDLNEHQRIKDIKMSDEQIGYLKLQLKQTDVLEIKNMFFLLIKEQYKIKLLANTRDEYFFEILDPAFTPEFKASPKRALICIIGTIIGFFFGCLMAYGSWLYPELKAKYQK